MNPPGVAAQTVAAAGLLLGSLFAQIPPEISPVPQLRELLRSEDATVRRSAAERLGTVSPGAIGLPAQVAVPDLLRVLESDGDRGVAEAAALALAAIGSWPPGALDHVADRLDGWAAAGAPHDAIARLRAALRVPERAWPGSAIVDDLVVVAAAARCTNDVLGVLAMLGEDGAAAVAAIDGHLGAKDAEVRWRAAFALALLGASRAPGLRAGVLDEEAAVRLWSLRARCAGEPVAPELAALVTPWLADERWLVRQWAFAAGQRLGAAFAVAVPQLVAMLSVAPVRHEALGALRHLGAHAAAAVPALVALLDAADDGVRDQAIEALAAMGPAAAAAAEPLLRLATAPRPTVAHLTSRADNEAMAAVAALGRIAPERAVEHLWPGVQARPAADDPSTWHAVQRFCCLGAGAASAVPRLRALLAEDDRLAKARALFVLVNLGDAAAPALPEVVPLLAGGDDYLRWMALRTIVTIGERAAGALPDLAMLFDRAGGNQRTDVIRDLARLGAAAQPLLVRATTEGDHWTRALAATQLLRLPQVSPAALAAVLARIDDPDAIVRQYAFSHLTMTPALAATALEQARRLLGAEDPQLRQASADLLWRSIAREVPKDPIDPWQADGFEELKYAWGFWQRPAADMALFRDAAGLRQWASSFVADHDARRRGAAAAVLGRLPFTVAGCEALQALAGDGDACVRRAAIAALGWLGVDAAPAAKVVGGAFGDADWAVRATAAMAIRAIHAASH